MESSSSSAYLESIQTETAWYDRQATKHRIAHLAAQGSIMVLSAATPFLAMQELKWLTVAAGGLIFALDGFSRLIPLEEHWLRYRSAAEALRRERRLFTSGKMQYRDVDDPENLFAEHVEAIIAGEHKEWVTSMKARVEAEEAGEVQG